MRNLLHPEHLAQHIGIVAQRGDHRGRRLVAGCGVPHIQGVAAGQGLGDDAGLAGDRRRGGIAGGVGGAVEGKGRHTLVQGVVGAGLAVVPRRQGDEVEDEIVAQPVFRLDVAIGGVGGGEGRAGAQQRGRVPADFLRGRGGAGRHLEEGIGLGAGSERRRRQGARADRGGVAAVGIDDFAGDGDVVADVLDALDHRIVAHFLLQEVAIGPGAAGRVGGGGGGVGGRLGVVIDRAAGRARTDHRRVAIEGVVIGCARSRQSLRQRPRRLVGIGEGARGVLQRASWVYW